MQKQSKSASPKIEVIVPKSEKMYAINHLSEAISTLAHALGSSTQVNVSHNTFKGIAKGPALNIKTED